MRRRLDVEAELAGVQDPFVRECLRILCEHYNKIWFDLRPEPLFREPPEKCGERLRPS